MELELWKPDQIAVSGTSNALIGDVEETARRVDENRPLPAEVVQRIEEELTGERVYSSNAIEGNTLDLRETIMILKTGDVSGGRKREAQEALNLGEAVEHITACIDGSETCHTREKLLEVHRILLHDIDDHWAGRFRERGVMIRGAVRQPPDRTMVPALVDRIMEAIRLDSETNKIVLASWAHWAIARVHPFHDGNGRMARLWQDLILLEGGLTCAIIRPQDRRNYLDALGQADEGEFNPLIQLVARGGKYILERYFDRSLHSGEAVRSQLRTGSQAGSQTLNSPRPFP